MSMSGQQVEDEIYRLQRFRLGPRLAAIVEEAEQALANGRDMEAEALVEKAAALLRLEMRLAS